MSSPLPPVLQSLAASWQATVRVPRRRAALALSVLGLVVALWLARRGTPVGRGSAAAALAAVAAVVAGWALREPRRWRSPVDVVFRLAGHIEPDRAARAIRALRLLEPGAEARHAGTSRELSELHVARTLSALPHPRIHAQAAKVAFTWAIVSLVAGAGVLAVAAVNPWALLEGADVLVARSGVAPVGMRWLDNVEIDARPPEYLHHDERREEPFAATALPRGTLLTLRGLPMHAGRRVALSDGRSEVPFVDDGVGGLVARWPLEASVELRVLARFGDVVIEEPDRTPVTSIADEEPVVVLDDAPRRVPLATAPDGGEISIRYQATDDHGLREIHLVLRSGTREERRVLARLDGETRFDRGGHVLRANDPFVKRSHVPVEVCVEAKDNDPITGPKWGRSASITLVPPEVGEPEAARLASLRALRDRLVDSLAWRMAREMAAGRNGAHVASEELDGAAGDERRLETTLATTFAGLRVPGKLQAMLRGHMRQVRDAVQRDAKARTRASHDTAVQASERMVLVVDGVLRGLGQRDARDAARRLADIADDVAGGAALLQRPTERERADARIDVGVDVLRGGARSLRALGGLGRDIGEIVEADLRRLGRGRDDKDSLHTELAARDLAARLRQPDPSFGSNGQSGRAGGETGGGRGAPGDQAESADDAEQAFNEAAQDLERLAADHASAVGEVEQALNGAVGDNERRAFAEEAKGHAQAVRDAASSLPSVGAGSDSWTSKGASAREHAEQMARSLEQGDPADAVSSGRNALNALDEARRTAARERWTRLGETSDADRRLEDVRRKLDPEVKWAEQQLEAMRHRAAERSRGSLSGVGEEEGKLAERSRALEKKGREEGALPAPALDALEGASQSAHEAAQSLRRGDAEHGLEQQRDAQRQLEMAREAMGEGEDEGRGDSGDAAPSFDRADIPKADAHKGPEDFRRRVIRGLGQGGSGKHKDAVRRYAEGLLR